jgi:hypothetical protein
MNDLPGYRTVTIDADNQTRAVADKLEAIGLLIPLA